MTPEKIDECIEKWLDYIDAQIDPIYMDVVPEPGAVELDCFPIVEKKVNADGGRMVLGWQIWANDYFIEGEAHAIWESPEGYYHDITPKSSGITKILFAEDDRLKYKGRQINNIRLNLTKNQVVDDFIFICDALFQFKNKGERADLHDLSKILTASEEETLKEMEYLKAYLGNFIVSGGTPESLCFCESGRKYKNCHGKDFRKNVSH